MVAISPTDDQRILQVFWHLDRPDYLSVSDMVLFKIGSQVHSAYQVLMTSKFNGDIIQQSDSGYMPHRHTLLNNSSGSFRQTAFYLKITFKWELVKCP
jgi:hypothetical protein